MARPRVDKEKKLSRRFIFRLTEDELARIITAAQTCGLPAGTLVRVKLFKGKFPQARTPRLDVQVYTELKRSGVNLNQLTRKVNSGQLPMELLSVLFKLQRQQETIIAILTYDSQPKDR